MAHFSYLSRYTIPPARAEEGPPGPGRSRPLCNQCSPDLIPRRTHPTGSRGPGRDNSRQPRRPQAGRERQTQAPTEHPRLAGAQRPRRASGKGAKFPCWPESYGQVLRGARARSDKRRRRARETDGDTEQEPE